MGLNLALEKPIRSCAATGEASRARASSHMQSKTDHAATMLRTGVRRKATCRTDAWSLTLVMLARLILSLLLAAFALPAMRVAVP